MKRFGLDFEPEIFYYNSKFHNVQKYFTLLVANTSPQSIKLFSMF